MKSIDEKITGIKDTITDHYDLGLGELKEIAPVLWEKQEFTFNDIYKVIMDAYYLGIYKGQNREKNKARRKRESK